MFYILETQREITCGSWLIGLHEVLNEVGALDVDYWLLQDFNPGGGYYFGMDYLDFVERTETEPKGFCVSPEELQIYCNADSQAVDGTFIAINSSAEEEPLLALDSFDAGCWYAATTSELIGERLIKCGWEQADMFPRLRGFSDWVNKFKNDKDVIESGVVFFEVE